MEMSFLNYRLCYVCPYDKFAWFTSIPIKYQWGDDWDDAPYEHNSGDPYGEHYIVEDNKIRKKHDLIKIGWSSEHEMPCSNVLNSKWSVKSINSGNVAWLLVPQWCKNENMKPIFAGTQLEEFIKIMKNCGGEVYLPIGLFLKNEIMSSIRY